MPLTLAQTTPQVAQLEVQFAAPLVKDSYVETVNDLIALDVKYNFPDIQKWVRSEKSWYCLGSGDGSVLGNWIKIAPKSVISMWDNAITYLKDQVVYLGTKIYIAKQNVPVNVSPIDYSNYWLAIGGSGGDTFRYIFENVSTIIIYTEVKNPVFDVWLGTLVKSGGNIVIDPTTGLASITDVERVDAPIKQREDLPPNAGLPYEISFYENSALSVQVSGCINVR